MNGLIHLVDNWVCNSVIIIQKSSGTVYRIINSWLNLSFFSLLFIASNCWIHFSPDLLIRFIFCSSKCRNRKPFENNSSVACDFGSVGSWKRFKLSKCRLKIISQHWTKSHALDTMANCSHQIFQIHLHSPNWFQKYANDFHDDSFKDGFNYFDWIQWEPLAVDRSELNNHWIGHQMEGSTIFRDVWNVR